LGRIILLEASIVLRGGGISEALAGGTSGHEGNVIFSLRFANDNDVGELFGNGALDGGIVGRQQNADLNTQNTLAEENVANSAVYEIGGGLTSTQHVTITELHALGTLGTEFTRYYYLATFSLVFHDEPQNTIASPAHSETTQKLVLQVLGLSNGTQSTVHNALSIEFNSAGGEVESLLNNRGELPDATSLVTKNVLGAGGSDDDLSAGRGNTDLYARVALLSELTSQELVKFGEEYTIGDELEVA